MIRPDIQLPKLENSQVAESDGSFLHPQDSPSTFQPIHNIIASGRPNQIPKKVLLNQTTNILLLSSAKSGGGFLGQLLNSIFPNTFYAFDPIGLAALFKVKHGLLY